MGIRFLVPFLVPLALRARTLYMCPHVSGTECMFFLKQDACGNLVVASLPVYFPFSAFCRRFLVRTSVGLYTHHTFLSFKNPRTDTFLRDLGLVKLRSTAWVGNPQGISKLVNKVNCCLSFMTASLRFAQGDSAGLPCYEILRSGILNVPLPYGIHLKVSHKGRHIFERLHPQQHRSAMDVTRDSWG
jgi:hypothetical protein